VSTLQGQKVVDIDSTYTYSLTTQASEKASVPQKTHLAKSKISIEGKRSLDVQEFQRFYQENLDLIYCYVFRRVGNRQEADDLTSQIFLKAVRNLDIERDAPSMQKWLFQVARTTIADYWRTYYRASIQSLDALAESGWESPAEEDATIINNGTVDRVQRLLQALPEHYRDVLTCRFLFTLSIKDTAARLGLTEANVKVLQYRALKRAAELENALTRSDVI
jgi:RNA polymerase sigma-70 factor, ECF subfamily